MNQQFPRSGTIRIHGTHIGVWEEEVDEDAILMAMRAVLGHCGARGHHVERDPQTERNYPSIAHLSYAMRKGDLRGQARCSGRMFELDFYQELVTENPNGGRYDFDKFSKMPRTIQLQCIVEMHAVIRKLRQLGYTPGRKLPAEPTLLDVRDAVAPPNTHGTLESFNERWNSEGDWKRGVHRFERDETGWPTDAEIGNHLDRDGVPIRNGEMRYVYHRGRLKRGVVRTNMNGMWSVGDFTYVSSRELFLCDPEKVPRRYVPHQRRRLALELERETKAENYPRVTALASVLSRCEPRAAA